MSDREESLSELTANLAAIISETLFCDEPIP